MTAPTNRNRLDEEASPYLRQHADNPVHWQPWDDEARAAARERDVPIFLSVGYAACHWCHVMEEESFGDDTVAEVLNDSFVPVKVDREERPDVDRIYQTACQLVSRRGGWPLSAWLTPTGEPFQVGTYFPRESRGGMPGFLDVLEDVASSWDDLEERRELERRGDRIASAIRGELEDVPESSGGPGAADGNADLGSTGVTRDPGGQDGPTAIERAARSAVRNADREHGGWGSGPKFPQPTRIEVLLEAASRDGGAGDPDADSYRSVATEALDAMVEGGLYDHLGGGFHRYCTDRDWTVPHFEKMLYDNAELPRVLVGAHQLTGDERYAEVVRETAAFLDRELAHDDGAFASTLDARSAIPPERTATGEPGEQEEGAYYVWTPEEVEAAIVDGAGEEETNADPSTLADLAQARWGITDAGNFEGRTVLTIDATVADLVARFGHDEDEIRALLDDASEQLLSAREERPRPRRDEKVIAAWNGLAIRALADASLGLDDPTLAARAAEALDAVRTTLWDGERLARRYVPDASGEPDGETAGPGGGTDVQGRGYLEDYAFLGRGALACYEATGDVDHLAFALDLGRVVLDQFYDDAAGTLYSTPAEGEDLIARPQEPMDQSTPSSLGVAADLLVVLDAFAPHDRFGDAASRVLDAHASRLERQPMQHASLALASDRLARGSTEVTVAAPDLDSDGLPANWRRWVAGRYLPRRIVAPRPAGADDLADWLDRLGFEEAPPIWRGRDATDGPTGYVCQQFACSRPLSDPTAADDWLTDGGSRSQ